jgi:hypothetical protein
VSHAASACAVLCCPSRRYRSTCHGLSAASGKAGAILGVFAFGDLKNRQGFPITFGMLAIFMCVCVFWENSLCGRQHNCSIVNVVTTLNAGCVLNSVDSHCSSPRRLGHDGRP